MPPKPSPDDLDPSDETVVTSDVSGVDWSELVRTVAGGLVLLGGLAAGGYAIWFAVMTLNQALDSTIHHGQDANVPALERILYAKAVVGAGALGFAALAITTGRKMLLPMTHLRAMKDLEISIAKLNEAKPEAAAPRPAASAAAFQELASALATAIRSLGDLFAAVAGKPKP